RAGPLGGAEEPARLHRRGGRSVPAVGGGKRRRQGADRGEWALAGRHGRTLHSPSGGQMIRINLMPAEEAQRAAGTRRELAVGTLVLAAAGLVFVLAHTWQEARMSSADRGLRRVTRELAEIQAPYADVTRIDQQKRELRDKLRVIGELEKKKV